MNPELDSCAKLGALCDEPLTMTSCEIAELTGRNHAHVMRDIRNMVEEISMNPEMDPCVKSTTYTGKDGRQYPQYEPLRCGGRC